MDYSAESPKGLKKMISMSGIALGYSVLRLRIAGGTKKERKALRRSGFFMDSKLVSAFKRKKKPPVLLKCVDSSKLESTFNGIDVMNPRSWRLLTGESH